jgi:putative peptide zinc metalloprotease protein
MSATAQPPASASGAPGPAGAPRAFDRAAGLELLGPLDGAGHEGGAYLVRRADGQVVQVGALQQGLLECLDGRRDLPALAEALTAHLGRRVAPEHVVAIAKKLAALGLLAGTEDAAPRRDNPLLALRWKVVVTDPQRTARLTRPFEVLFRPWIAVPVLLAFAATLVFVLVAEGLAPATAQAFADPELILLVFGLGVASAGFHELGHAAAARYGGSTPGAMGAGVHLVWPAFYTDVTDSYRLPRRDRLRVDLGGLHFNAVVAVATMAAWLVTRVDALLLLVALQVLQMVRQLPPLTRLDGYHVLADLTGVPDLYAHLGPTLRRLLPGHRDEPSALTGRARLVVTVWALVTIPLLLVLLAGMLLVLPRLLATAWASGGDVLDEAGGGPLDAAVAGLRLLALVLPVLGGLVLAQRLLAGAARRGLRWADGRPGRRVALAAGTAVAMTAAAWALWPAGQYERVRATDGGTVLDLAAAVAAPQEAARPAPAFRLPAGRHRAIALVPKGGATAKRPALLVVPREDGPPAVVVVGRPPRGREDDGASGTGAGSATPATAGASAAAAAPSDTTGAPDAPKAPDAEPAPGVAFPFELPGEPREGDTQALAVNREDGGVVYDVSYAVVTVGDGAPVTNANSAFAIASCDACTTVAVSFQVVLVVGQTDRIAPINAAGAVNLECPACTTTAIAYQLVISLSAAPDDELLARLTEQLRELDDLPSTGGDPQDVLDTVLAVRDRVEEELDRSGLTTRSREGTATTTTTTPEATETAPAPPPATTTAPPTSTAPAPAAAPEPEPEPEPAPAPEPPPTTEAAPPPTTTEAAPAPTTTTEAPAPETTTTPGA